MFANFIRKRPPINDVMPEYERKIQSAYFTQNVVNFNFDKCVRPVVNYR